MAYSAVSISFLNIFVARDAGLFKKHGLDVKLVFIASGPVGTASVLGTETGTSIVNVTNPAAPYEVGFIPGLASIWREMKQYRSWIYVSTEAIGGVAVRSRNGFRRTTRRKSRP